MALHSTDDIGAALLDDLCASADLSVAMPKYKAESEGASMATTPRRHREPGRIRMRDRYVAAALEDELSAVRTARPGYRNSQLWRSAWALARFVNNGMLAAGDLEETMVEAAQDAGLSAREAAATVCAALRARVAV